MLGNHLWYRISRLIMIFLLIATLAFGLRSSGPVCHDSDHKKTEIVRKNYFQLKRNKPVALVEKKLTGSLPASTPQRLHHQILPADFMMLVRLIHAEAGGEPFQGQVAVGAVIMNRMRSDRFPKTIAGNVLKNGEFESVSNGYLWSRPSVSAYRAALLALKGWDPTHGALFFYNPAKTRSAWIWNRLIIAKIGQHYFAS